MKKTKQSKGMIDVSQKKITKRVAVAAGKIFMSEKALRGLLKDECPKGNVLETARVAGIMAAKSTPRIIPYCHPLALDNCQVEVKIDQKQNVVLISAQVTCHGKTGVEMEALTAVSVAALTIYDMMKSFDRSMKITDIKLTLKKGGKSGTYRRSQ